MSAPQTSVSPTATTAPTQQTLLTETPFEATATVTATVTSTPIVADDGVWLNQDDLVIYSLAGNLCMKDGESDPVFLMPATACEYDARLYEDDQIIVILSSEADPTYGCYSETGHGTGVWSADRQNGQVTHLTSTLEIAERLEIQRVVPIWSFQQVPGSDAFVFNTAEVSHGVRYSKDLYLVDKSGQLTILLEPGDGAMSFALSPNGKHIAYVSRDEENEPRSTNWIGLIDTSGENWRPRVVTYDWIATYSEWTILTDAVWAPDSSGFWVAVPPPNRRDGEVPNLMTTWYVPVDGEPVQLGSFERSFGVIYDATFSPDGKLVAYVAEQTELPLEDGLHIMRPDGLGEYVYYGENVSGFSYWEDSTHFIFWTENYTYRYRGGIGEEPAIIGTRGSGNEVPIPVPDEGCAP